MLAPCIFQVQSFVREDVVMSVKSGIKPTSQLTETLVAMRAETSPVQVLRVQVVDDQLVETATLEGPPTRDLAVLAPLADGSAACYFLVRTTATKWRLVQWVPTTLVKVKERMVYASTTPLLKEAFGPEYIYDVTNVTTREELGMATSPRGDANVSTFSSNSGNSSSTALASGSSISLPDRLKNESMLSAGERAEREAILSEQQAQREIQAAGKTGIGGYKAASVVVADGVTDAIAQFRVGDVNFVQMAMSEDQKKVECIKSSMVRENEVDKNVNEKEPRFYLYSFGGAVRKNVFVYCCPEKSPTKLRMVYSTAKPTVVNFLVSSGLELAKKLEVSDIADMTHQAIVAASKDDSRFGGGAAASPSASPRVAHGAAAAHPLFGHVGGGETMSPGKAEGRSAYEAAVLKVGNGKKIVLPPPVAYQ